MVLKPKLAQWLHQSADSDPQTKRQRFQVLQSLYVQRSHCRKIGGNVMEKQGMIRIWFADVKTFDDLETALSEARSYLEEILIGKNTGKIEIWCVKRTPTIPEVAGYTS